MSLRILKFHCSIPSRQGLPPSLAQHISLINRSVAFLSNLERTVLAIAVVAIIAAVWLALYLLPALPPAGAVIFDDN